MHSHCVYCDNALFVMRESNQKRLCTKLIEFLKMLSLKLYIFLSKKRREIDKILRYITGLLSSRPLIPEAPSMPKDFESSLSIYGDTQCVMTEWKIDPELGSFLNGQYSPIMESLGCGEKIYLSNISNIDSKECMEESEVEIPNDFINNGLKEFRTVTNSSQACFVKSPSRGKNKSIPLLRGNEQGTSHLQPGGSPKPFTGFFC